MLKPDLVAPAGIRQAHPIHPKALPHSRWSREATWGDLGAAVHHHSLHRLNAIPGYLKKKTEDPSCVYDGWTPQNAAHLQRCSWIEDVIGRDLGRREVVRGGGEVSEIDSFHVDRMGRAGMDRPGAGRGP